MLAAIYSPPRLSPGALHLRAAIAATGLLQTSAGAGTEGDELLLGASSDAYLPAVVAFIGQCPG